MIMRKVPVFVVCVTGCLEPVCGRRGESLGLVLFYAHIVLRSRYFQVCDLWGNDEYAVKSYIFKYLIYTRLKLCSTVFL